MVLKSSACASSRCVCPERSHLVGGPLLVSLGAHVVGMLLGLVLDGIDASLSTTDKPLLVNCPPREREILGARGATHRVPMLWLLSLATFLLASLEAPLVAPANMACQSTVCSCSHKSMRDPTHHDDVGCERVCVAAGGLTLDLVRDVVTGVLDGIHYAGWMGEILVILG